MPADTDDQGTGEPDTDDAAAEPTSGDGVAGGAVSPAGAVTRSGPPLAITIVLAVIAVVLAVLLVILLRDRGDLRADADRQSEIATAVSDFGHAVLTYDHVDVDATVDAVNELVTDRMREELATGYLGMLRAQIEALEATSEAEVVDVLVSETRGDTARAIAVIHTNVASVSTRAQVTAYLEVSLLLVDGQWLANEMRALNTEGGLVDGDGNPIGGAGDDGPDGEMTIPGDDGSVGPTTIPDETE